MQKKVLNYRVIINSDERTGSKEICYTAYVPVLGIATDGDTVEEALKNVNEAILVYVQSLVQDEEKIPQDLENADFVTTARVEVSIPTRSL